MTDSVGMTVDLSHLPFEERLKIPLITSRESDQHGDQAKKFIKPSKQFSPMSGTKTKWIVRVERIGVADVPASIDADFNLPNALVGHNLEHGTSVYAAGVSGLWLIKIWLAEAGVSREYLDLVTTKNVTFRSVTLTYLITLPSEVAAKELVDDLCLTARILNKRTELYESSNKTMSMPNRSARLLGYHKTLLGFCSFPSDAPEAELVDHNSRIVRLESKLSNAFLAQTGLWALDSWRTAYRDGLYEILFRKTVLEPFRLDLRHNRPRPEVVANLTPTERMLLDMYLLGGDPRQFPSVLQSAYPSDTRSKLRKSILKKSNVDIDIPWEEHVQLKCFKLKHQLVYPGDYHPDPEVASWCFCEENWCAIQEKLIALYEATVIAAEHDAAELAKERASRQPKDK